MSQTLPSIFPICDKQYRRLEDALLAVGKLYKSKRAAEAEEALIFLEIYAALVGRLRQKEELHLPDAFKRLQRYFRRTRHLKAIENQYMQFGKALSMRLPAYAQTLEKEKLDLYTEAFEEVLTLTPAAHAAFHKALYKGSKGVELLPLHQTSQALVEEELAFIRFCDGDQLDAPQWRQVFEALQRVVVLENIRLSVGIESIFLPEMHQRFTELLVAIRQWFEVQLFLQHLSYYVSMEEHTQEAYRTFLVAVRARRKAHLAHSTLLLKTITRCL
ncbi:MAG: hypothetical protein ACXIT9_10940 [Nitritalea sp.]